ncbi:RHS repeat protein [Janthinobacterium sp. B9-8]|uniref:RHS repeat protein n=1 Tax=Janthinobacterium sp. B9-8 TaxID=1236179 RepID=UPI0018D22B8D|nr:RHS repeat protein [Janthinobacterium sp. B9-8]
MREKTTFAPPPYSDVDPDWLMYKEMQSSADNISHYLLERENGLGFVFDLNGQPKNPSESNPYQLTVSDNGFTVKNGTAIENYDKLGQLLSIVYANGMIDAFIYNAQKQLTQVKNNYGQQLTFDYADSVYLKHISLNGALIVSYSYNKGLLSNVTYVDNTSRQYLYEDSRNPTLLTGLIDESGQRFASWTYNEQGQAISSEHAGGVDKFTLNFGGDPASGTRWTEETDPLGSVRRYQFKLVAGTWRLHGKDQPGGAGCSAASNNLLYDANGNVTSRTDFNGNKTTYVYDLARNLETSRTEAAGTPLARTISTEWHATWRLPLKVTEPGRVTSFVYDANANLLNKTITADGKTRRWSWTYADFGQVKTSTDPDGKTSSYQYDAQGNLAAQTNAAQQITQFTRYDANGNPLEILSPDGIKSTLTYDARNRLISRQAGAALSRFEYWPTGLLKQATLPDGLVINYLYDTAHRLSEITDNQGHREVYTLNKAGLQEQVDRYDPDSTLANGLLQVQQAQSVKPAK